MERATIRRRRFAAASACGLAAGAFAFGAALGDGTAPPPAAAERLPLPQLAGQRVATGFEGAAVPPSVRRMIREGRLGGVILFAGNLPSRDGARRLIAELQSIRRPAGLRDPLLVMVDQEGGLVKRLAGAPTASARVMGARGAAFSRDQGRRTARNLRGVGFNVDLAPVLDVARPGGVIAETDRGFGSSAASVARTAIPFAAGLEAGGVAATAKHFPGFGAARLNTDFAVQRIALGGDVLRRVDEKPYGRFGAMGAGLVMLSTAIYPAFDSRPAAFSRAIATGELRNRLGFRGVSLTDALDSVAARAFGGPARAGMAAARAGADILLYTSPGSAARAHRALTAGLRAGRLSEALFQVSAGRVLRLRHRLGR